MLDHMQFLEGIKNFFHVYEFIKDDDDVGKLILDFTKKINTRLMCIIIHNNDLVLLPPYDKKIPHEVIIGDMPLELYKKVSSELPKKAHDIVHFHMTVTIIQAMIDNFDNNIMPFIRFDVPFSKNMTLQLRHLVQDLYRHCPYDKDSFPVEHVPYNPILLRHIHNIKDVYHPIDKKFDHEDHVYLTTSTRKPKIENSMLIDYFKNYMRTNNDYTIDPEFKAALHQ